jgi:signal transduction histidine kinase
MRDSIVLVFLVYALMLAGVLTSASTYIRDEYSKSQEIKLWLASIFLSIIGLILFAIGTATTAEAIKTNSVVFTFANAFYLASIVFQTLFCFSLRGVVSKKTIYIFLLGVFAFAVHFEYLRGSGNFVGRVLEVAFLTSSLLVTQLFSLRKALRVQTSTQLKFLFAFTFLELAMVIGRLLISAMQVNPVLSMSEIPMSLMAVIWFNLAFNVLSYLTMLGFWSERAKLRQLAVATENERIASLLSEREALINSLLLSNKSAAAGALSASLAHELNQPIGASRINLFTLKKHIEDKSIGDKELDTIIGRMEFDNQRAGEIVSALRAMFSQAPQEVERINLSALVGSTISLVSGECKVYQIALQIDVPKELEVQVSRVELQQVLLNLLNNAIDALKEMPKELVKQITINATQKDGFAQLTVQDNGPGISAQVSSQVFELFSSKKQSGLGVGLWLSRYIMERSGGSIACQPNLAGGSQFVLNIPL